MSSQSQKTEDNAVTDVEQLLENLEVEEEDKNTNDNFSSDYYIDEVQIKDLDFEQSEAQLEERKVDAIQLKDEGNKLFKEEKYVEASKKYTSALKSCPLKYENDRAILFANRGACFMKNGQSAEAIEDCSKSIELNAGYLKAYKRRAVLYEEADKLDEALEDFKKVFELDKTDQQAATAIRELPSKINERNEKLKEQMLGTLKDLGNKILRPFGLSTDNFKLQQDPNTGGYTVNFGQNNQ